MIANKILPASYVIEILGDSAKTFCPDGFKLDGIVAISNSYDTDMEAIADFNKIMVDIRERIAVDFDEEIQMNPEFFPTFEGTLDDEQKSIKEQNDMVLAEAKFSSTHTGYAELDILSVFDPSGDYLEMKWTIVNNDSFVLGKLLADPQKYVEEKTAEVNQMLSATIADSTRVVIH